MRRLVLALAIAATLAPPALAEAPSTAFIHLRDMGVAVALPAVVPPGFKLTNVLVPKAWAGTAFGPSYVALYDGPGGKGFAIESVGADVGGIGDGGDVPVAEVGAPYFPRQGPVGLYWRAPRENMAKSWVSDWLEGPQQFYRLVGPAHVRNDHGEVWRGRGEIDRAWAIRILASIRPASGGVAGTVATPGPKPFFTDFEQDDQWRDLRTVPVR